MQSNQYHLEQLGDQLALVSDTASAFNPITVDFVAGAEGHRRQFGGSELIVKAVGCSKNKNLTVLDCTAGLGRDAFVLANKGCAVTMLERSDILFQLLQDGMRRYNASDLPLLQWELLQADAFLFLQNLSVSEKKFDVIYCDPMYPERKKTALVKKELRVIRELVGDDGDADLLLPMALERAKSRVVVKRPKLADFLANLPPSFQVIGKSGRFDVYLI